MLDGSAPEMALTPADLPSPKRVDLHVHTLASSKAGEAALKAIDCPECYSEPDEVARLARLRGMDFVCITDHDTIAGVASIAAGGDSRVIVGEEVTTRFPEDKCCFHLLVYGIDARQHERLQSLRDDVYAVADYIVAERIAHSVAHPLYRQNDRLTRWHLERLLLLFKGFEVLNGAHSSLHRESIEPVLNNLTRQSISDLADAHKLVPKWPEPWFKARTGGSDDHGLLNVGRTWTEFPHDVATVEDVLNGLRTGACQAGGEAGSSIKLAHQFFSVGAKYYGRQIAGGAGKREATDMSGLLVSALVGDRSRPTSKLTLARAALRAQAAKLTQRVRSRWGKKTGLRPPGAALLSDVFADGVRKRLDDYPAFADLMKQGIAPLAGHRDAFSLLSEVNRDLSEAIFDAARDRLAGGSLLGVFDAVAQVAAHQFFLMPYYFALFHQNKERSIMPDLARERRRRTADTLRVGLFTDTLDDLNGVARFIRDMGEQAGLRDYHFTIHTSVAVEKFDVACRVNFKPLLSRPMPFYDTISLNLPPVLEILEFADRQQYDVIHCSTPGPMGMTGYLVARMLRAPLAGTYHTDFPSYVDHLTGDHRFTDATTWFMKWFYARMRAVFSRSQGYRSILKGFGLGDERLKSIVPGINTDKFNAGRKVESLYHDLGIAEPYRLLYAGRISVEKNLPLLVEAFKMICRHRRDIALVIAGEGPYEAEMRKQLAGLPAHFQGALGDKQLAPLYAGADLFVFPSRTDTLGQVVMEAQASGLPAIVSDEGGPKEIVDDDLTGIVLPATDAMLWAGAIEELIDDHDRRHRYGRIAITRSARYSLSNTFDAFWGEHLNLVEPGEQGTHPATSMRPAVEPLSV